MTLKYFDMAELALAAYATLNRGPTVNQVSMLGKAGFAGAQAQSFLDRFPTVVAQYNDTSANGGLGTGFSVTVFQDASSTRNLAVAIRGTEQLTQDLLFSDYLIAVDGAAYDQRGNPLTHDPAHWHF